MMLFLFCVRQFWAPYVLKMYKNDGMVIDI